LTFNRPSIEQEVSPYDIRENKLSGNTLCQIVFFSFFSLSESFTGVGDEEKFELGKGDENIKPTSNEKQSLCGASELLKCSAFLYQSLIIQLCVTEPLKEK